MRAANLSSFKTQLQYFLHQNALRKNTISKAESKDYPKNILQHMAKDLNL
jgi:hypothetical protein